MTGININLAALNAQRSATRTSGELTEAIGRLSSGLRINGAKDDAAGLAIADRLTSQVRGLNQASRNANDAISLAQAADGALASVSSNLQRVRELAVQSANGTNSASDRAALQLEASQLVSEIDRVARQTQFNGANLLDGSFSGKAFQVGANAGQSITLPAIASMRSASLGVYQGVSDSLVNIGAANSGTDVLTIAAGSSGPIDLGQVAGDPRSIAAAINNAHVPGLSVTANPLVIAASTSSANATVSGTAQLTINGVAVALAGTTGGAALASNRAAAVSAINSMSGATGVVASITGQGVSLVAADGRSIELGYTAGGFTNSQMSDFGLTGMFSQASFSLSYVAPPGSTGWVQVEQDNALLSYGGYIGPTGTPLAALDLSTVAGANAALASIDRTLATVNSSRASLGAVQSRFAAAIANVQSAGENVAAARSRIEDADFAQETANLSRAQVLQEAGTAMVAQANQLPQQMMQLLR